MQQRVNGCGDCTDIYHGVAETRSTAVHAPAPCFPSTPAPAAVAHRCRARQLQYAHADVSQRTRLKFDAARGWRSAGTRTYVEKGRRPSGAGRCRRENGLAASPPSEMLGGSFFLVVHVGFRVVARRASRSWSRCAGAWGTRMTRIARMNANRSARGESSAVAGAARISPRRHGGTENNLTDRHLLAVLAPWR